MAVYIGILLVKVIRANDLVAGDVDGLSDPYVSLKLAGQKVKTKVVDDSLNPTWNETLHLCVERLDEPLILRVLDEDLVGRDFLGSATIPCASHIHFFSFTHRVFQACWPQARQDRAAHGAAPRRQERDGHPRIDLQRPRVIPPFPTSSLLYSILIYVFAVFNTVWTLQKAFRAA